MLIVGCKLAGIYKKECAIRYSRKCFSPYHSVDCGLDGTFANKKCSI